MKTLKRFILVIILTMGLMIPSASPGHAGYDDGTVVCLPGEQLVVRWYGKNTIYTNIERYGLVAYNMGPSNRWWSRTQSLNGYPVSPNGGLYVDWVVTGLGLWMGSSSATCVRPWWLA